jgi:transposase
LEECLALYGCKDVVKKGFDVLKNDIELMPANLKTNISIKGYLFIALLALIMRMKLVKMMNEAELSKRCSVELLLTELEKTKVMVLLDGEKIITEVTKKQQEILNALLMCA